MRLVKMYGISNCDMIRKAKDWFKAMGTRVEFHDYKKEGISGDKLAEWCRLVGWEMLLNRNSSTWKSLPAEEQQQVQDEQAAIEVMIRYTSIIKRPVVETGKKLVIGFDKTYFINK